jgi:hypothetical protein
MMLWYLPSLKTKAKDLGLNLELTPVHDRDILSTLQEEWREYEEDFEVNDMLPLIGVRIISFTDFDYEHGLDDLGWGEEISSPHKYQRDHPFVQGGLALSPGVFGWTLYKFDTLEEPGLPMVRFKD